MADSTLLPGSHARLVGSDGKPTPEFFRFFRSLIAYVEQSGGNTADLAELTARVAALEADGGSLASLLGTNGITVFGQITDPIVRIRLTAYLGDLLNVDDVTVPPTDQDALAFDLVTETWVPRAVVVEVQAGANVAVDNTDPKRPIVSAETSAQTFNRIDGNGDIRIAGDGSLRITS